MSPYREQGVMAFEGLTSDIVRQEARIALNDRIRADIKRAIQDTFILRKTTDTHCNIRIPTSLSGIVKELEAAGFVVAPSPCGPEYFQLTLGTR